MASARTYGGTTLCIGDNFGRVRLYRYPCVNEEPNYAEVLGHGGPVSNIVLTMDDAYVLSMGELDCCVFQWRHVMGGAPDDEQVTEEEADSRRAALRRAPKTVPWRIFL